MIWIESVEQKAYVHHISRSGGCIDFVEDYNIFSYLSEHGIKFEAQPYHLGNYRYVSSIRFKCTADQFNQMLKHFNADRSYNHMYI